MTLGHVIAAHRRDLDDAQLRESPEVSAGMGTCSGWMWAPVQAARLEPPARSRRRWFRRPWCWRSCRPRPPRCATRPPATSRRATRALSRWRTSSSTTRTGRRHGLPGL